MDSKMRALLIGLVFSAFGALLLAAGISTHRFFLSALSVVFSLLGIAFLVAYVIQARGASRSSDG